MMMPATLARLQRHGFALLAVLWILAGISALGLAASLVGREAVAAAQNRADLTRAAWRAEDCLERARAVIGEILSDRPAGPGGERAAWATLDRVVASSPLVASAGCEVILRAAGASVDLNAAEAEMLHALFLALGLPPARSDSMVDALLDWRDPDDVPRPLGAERSWYESQGRFLPRDGPLADPREFVRVRGFETLEGVDRVLGVEPGRIALDHAPLEVLAALPGFTEEAVARVAERRMRGLGVGSLLALMEELAPNSRAALLARYGDLARQTTVEPDAWIVTSRARVGTPPVTAVAEVRLVRAGSRAAILRRRSWWS